VRFPELQPPRTKRSCRRKVKLVRCLDDECGWVGPPEDIVHVDRDFGSYYAPCLLPVPVCPCCGKDLC